jgi:putative hydrolase
MPGTDETRPDGPAARAIEALGEAVRYLDRSIEPRSKVTAFVRAADLVRSLPETELLLRTSAATLEELPGIGPSTGAVIAAAVRGDRADYLDRLEERTRIEPGEGSALHSALRGDCHSHTTWSDGGASLEEMARAAIAIGREYLVVTDHSPRLTIAHGLSPERLEAQLVEIGRLNRRLEPFRVLTGMEVDILADGSLDLPDELLGRLDVVVASAHSKLAMPADQMTTRLLLAVANQHVDVLGHCTGRKVTGRGRPPSAFDADLVFAACAQHRTAVEINCRPERRDPPTALLRRAVEHGCLFSIDSDAHSPGQLEWLAHGCRRAVRCGIEPGRVINTWPAEVLLAWTGEDGATGPRDDQSAL